ncbi:MAG: hypothetical protein IJ877_08390 [Candidatus Gastranaerophilales bacterium]|nr:hypothetical protein [Candidatus Gastranaerophilales bacterium]
MLGKINKNTTANLQLAAAKPCFVKLNSQIKKDEFVKTSKKEVSFTSRNGSGALSYEQLVLDKVKGTKYENRPSIAIENVEAYRNTPWFKDMPDDDLVGIFEKVEFNGSAIYQIVSYSFIDKALSLSWLIDEGIITKEDIDSFAQDAHSHEDSFVTALYSDRFHRVIDLAKNKAKNYQGDNPDVVLFAMGVPINSIKQYKNILDYDNIVKNIDKDFQISFVPIQNSKLAEAKAWKSRQDDETGNLVTIIKTFLPDNTMTISRSERKIPQVHVNSVGNYEINGKNSHIDCHDTLQEPKIGTYLEKNWTINGELSAVELDMPVYSASKNGKRTLITRYSDFNNIDSQIEIVSDFEPYEVIYTRQSDILKGAYDTTIYDLKDYPEDYDIIKGIEEGTIQGGRNIAQTGIEKGQTFYRENYSYNQTSTTRYYSEVLDDKDNVMLSEYSYRIDDDNGENLFNLERTFFRDKITNTNTTVINGEKYMAYYSNKDYFIEIYLPNGTKKVLDLSDKLHSVYWDDKEKYDKVFEFFKTLPADILLEIEKYTSSVCLFDDCSASINRSGELKTIPSLPVIAHELGHGADYYQIANSYFDKAETKTIISSNPELIEIYNSEIDNFKKEYPQISENIIDYFSQSGGGDSNTGLSELTAECFMLCATYGMDKEKVTTRSNFLVKYFPRTVAKACQMILDNKANLQD